MRSAKAGGEGPCKPRRARDTGAMRDRQETWRFVLALYSSVYGGRRIKQASGIDPEAPISREIQES
jgi:hypothetical protein